jgi:5'-nucleotidase
MVELKNYGGSGERLRCLAAGILALSLMGMTKPSTVILSIVATTDLHGAALPDNGLGGLPRLAGFVNNLRAIRASDGGAVLLIDSGDTFQGGIESDLSEGALVVDAYNAMGYAAEAIGNHDFDFGSVDSPAARQLPGDLRGAIRSRAVQARYPFLAANLIDEATGRLVTWTNVRPSAMVETAGARVGIVGVMTIDALQSTIAANVSGLRVAPLAPAIQEHATKLRAAGADVVVVAAHAGGRCERFDRPDDLSSCENDTEIFKVARSLPPGLVDVIAAGHTHAAIAHIVNGIAIVQSLSRGQAFSRADIVFDRDSRRVLQRRPFAPVEMKGATQYEGRPVVADPTIADAMAPALGRVRRLQATTLGVSLAAPILRGGDFGSPLGRVFADAILAASPGADAAVVNGATRGLRADLAAGPMTFGRLYDVFPFDNRVARVTITGRDLRLWLTEEIQQGRQNGLGISGVDVSIDCRPDGSVVSLRRDGRPIQDRDRLQIATIGSPTLSGSIAFVSTDGAGRRDDERVVREAVEDWMKQHPHPDESVHGILGLPCVPF